MALLTTAPRSLVPTKRVVERGAVVKVVELPNAITVACVAVGIGASPAVDEKEKQLEKELEHPIKDPHERIIPYQEN